MANTYIARVDSTDGNKKVWTWSAWVKRDNTDTSGQNMFSAGGNNVDEAQFKFSNNQLSFFNDYATTGRVSATSPSRLFRDMNGWYHFVWRHKVDETSNDDRWKIYINGERLQPSDYGSPAIPNEEGVYNRFTNKQMWFGARAKAQFDSSYQYFSGLMSHIHFCDGYAYDATDFGEYDANGVWKIKTSPSVNYGTHGFFILKDGNSVTDQSGNGNNCTVGGGNLTNTEDSPSNVFATLNSLDNEMSNFTFANGNTSVTTAQAGYRYARSTLGMTAGKYYFEVKNVSHPANPNNDHYNRIGITDTGVLGSLDQLGKGAYDYSLVEVDGKVENNNTTTAYGVSYSTDGDIVGCALDLDNSKIYWHKNGTWMNSADPSAGTGGYSITPVANTGTGAYFFGVGEGGSSLSSYFNVNFGNGYFGTTAVASAGTNASGNGIFEYDVPTGYTALSTKGLNL